MAAQAEKIILLNWLVSRSSHHARSGDAPKELAINLFKILNARRVKGWAIEYQDMPDELDEEKRVKLGAGYSFTRLCDVKFEETNEYIYASLLIKYGDHTARGFSVENALTFKGREIEADENEIGVTAAHIMARLPNTESQLLNYGEDRCVIEAVPHLSRGHIQRFLCRQLRRHSDANAFTYSAMTQGKRGKVSTKELRYTPRLEFHGDVGRTIGGAPGDNLLSQMVFTKRSERQQIGKPADIIYEDVVANMRIKINASQGPKDPEEKKSWAANIVRHYTMKDYQVKLLFQHHTGHLVGGFAHQAIDGATDLLMCQKAFLPIAAPAKPWEPSVSSEVVKGMREVLDQDELWERKK